MEQLWAPWRMTYIRGDEKPPGCVFCLPATVEEDDRRLILKRGENAFILMNKYPYSNAHLMIAPYQHTCDPGSLSDAEALEMHRFLVLSREVLHDTVAPQGFNIGMNLGLVAGAGIADHLHLHIVPRWNGDTNFMPVFSDVRVIPQHLDETYRILRNAFEGRSL